MAILCLSLVLGLFPVVAGHAVAPARGGLLLSVGADPVREARNIAWKAAGEATKARAATSQLRTKINRMGAEKAAAEATQVVNGGTQIYLPQAAISESAAKASLQQALAYEQKVKAILQTVDANSYQAAKAAALKEVSKLDVEAKKYYQSLVGKFKALALPGPPTAAQTAAKAAQPYMDVELRVGALVQYYNEKAMDSIKQAQSAAMQAKSIALTAQTEQASGNVEMAQRHMMQAHMLVGVSSMKKQEALKIRKLAENLNMSIPSYQQAAQQAAAHALATFAGLQQDKVHIEMRQKVAESTRQVEKALATMETALAQTSKLLQTQQVLQVSEV